MSILSENQIELSAITFKDIYDIYCVLYVDEGTKWLINLENLDLHFRAGKIETWKRVVENRIVEFIGNLDEQIIELPGFNKMIANTLLNSRVSNCEAVPLPYNSVPGTRSYILRSGSYDVMEIKLIYKSWAC